MMMYWRSPHEKKVRAVSIVMPCSCSSREGIKKKGILEFFSLAGGKCLEPFLLYPSGSEPVSAYNRPKQRGFAMIHMSHDDNVHAFLEWWRLMGMLTCILLFARVPSPVPRLALFRPVQRR